MKTKLFKYLVGYIITTFEITIDADKAATDPPPGLGDLAPTVNTKSFTSIWANGPYLSSVIIYLGYKN